MELSTMLIAFFSGFLFVTLFLLATAPAEVPGRNNTILEPVPDVDDVPESPCEPYLTLDDTRLVPRECIEEYIAAKRWDE